MQSYGTISDALAIRSSEQLNLYSAISRTKRLLQQANERGDILLVRHYEEKLTRQEKEFDRVCSNLVIS